MVPQEGTQVALLGLCQPKGSRGGIQSLQPRIWKPTMTLAESFHRLVAFLPTMAKFAVFMTLAVIMPRLSRYVRLPEAVGLLLSGVVIGPHMLDVFPRQHPVADFFSELGMLLLMFFAAWKSTCRCFWKRSPGRLFSVCSRLYALCCWARWRPIGSVTGYFRLLWWDHCSLHTRFLDCQSCANWERLTVNRSSSRLRATMMSDTVSLLVFAVCVPLRRRTVHRSIER
jgi:Sodium/hydrogen exchanger family